MNCLVCGKTVSKNKNHLYSWVGKRKVYACDACHDGFDAAREKAELAVLARIAKTWTDDPKQAASLIEWYLAGQSGTMPCKP